MSSTELKCKLSDAVRDSGEFAAVVRQLTATHHSVFVGKGALLPALLGKDGRKAPLLIIRSERVSEEWVIDAGGPEFAIDGCDNAFGSVPYLVWSDGDLTLAVATIDISDAIHAGQNYGATWVAWVTDDSVILTSFAVDEEFIDDWYATSRALLAQRFVPSDEYIESVHATFPPLLSEAEQRFIGELGEPTYVAQLCE